MSNAAVVDTTYGQPIETAAENETKNSIPRRGISEFELKKVLFLQYF